MEIFSGVHARTFFALAISLVPCAASAHGGLLAGMYVMSFWVIVGLHVLCGLVGVLFFERYSMLAHALSGAVVCSIYWFLVLARNVTVTYELIALSYLWLLVVPILSGFFANSIRSRRP